MKLRIYGLAAIATTMLASSSFAQTFTEIEPNNQKVEATAVTGIVAGDTIGGLTTGTTSTLGLTTAVTMDYFRVKTAANTLGIYKHQLTITTTGTAGHSGTIRGLSQSAGVIGTSDFTLQSTLTTSTPPRHNAWYGFGKQEEIYYRVNGTASTTADYLSTLTTTTITPTLVAGTYAGVVTIRTTGQTTADTHLSLYDSGYNPVADNDDEGPGGPTLQSRIIKCLNPGTYYLAAGNSNQATNLAADAAEDFLTATVMDFPNGLVCSSSSLLTADWDFEVSDGTTTTPVTNTRVAGTPFQTNWYEITVVAVGSAPANDACASAAVITTGVVAGNLTAATNDGIATCDTGGLASKDVWYSFTNTLGAPSLLKVNTCATAGIDTVLTAYSVCGVEIAGSCNDNCGGSPCGGPTSCMSLPLATAQTVIIRVSDNGLGGGCFEMSVSNSPLNDLCATPQVLPGPGVYAINNSQATTGPEGQANGICLFSATTAIAKDLWYTYTATANGTATVTTCGLIATGPSQDSKIAAYLGAGCPAAAAIGCNDDFTCTGFSGLNSTLSFAVTCGTTYTLQIGMFGNSTSSMLGSFSLTEVGSACNTVFTPYCDTTDVTLCPCTNQGLAGRGCENTAATGGGLLTSTGVADTSADTLVLSGSFLVPFGPGLYYQGSLPVTPGVAFGNGLRCAGGATPRIEIVVDNGLGGDVTAGDGITKTTVSVSAFGGVVAPATHYYQLWYRDTGNVGTCLPGAGFNFTNAISLPWVP